MFRYKFEGSTEINGETTNYVKEMDSGPTWDIPAVAFVQFLRGAGFYLHPNAEDRIIDALATNASFGD